MGQAESEAITHRLENYLSSLSEINKRWTQWLAESEQAAINEDNRLLVALQPTGMALLEELRITIGNREQLLVEARQLGVQASSLESLVRLLPSRNPTLRKGIEVAKRQMENLRRLHVATWILLSQKMMFYRDSKTLLSMGTLRQDVYADAPNLEGGGQLLDASL